MAAQRSQPPSALATRDAVLPVTVETASAAAAAQAKALVETRFLVALHRPRDWDKVRDMIFAACERAQFAEEGMYALDRGGSSITGLSARFAEEAVRWIGNAMADAIVVYDDDEKRIVRVVVTDLEANVTYPTDVVIDKSVERRSAAGREVLGKRVNAQNQVVYRVRCTDDELREKQNNMVSKGRRNEILRLLPADLQEQAKARIRATLEGAAKGENRKLAIPSMVLAFAGLEIPVTEDELRGYLQHPIEEITPDEFATLRGLYQAIKDGETTWDGITRGKGQGHQTQGRRDAGIRSGGYEQGAPVKAEVREVKPLAPRPLPDDPYLATKRPPKAKPGMVAGDEPDMTEEEQRAFDQRLAEEEG